jgi:hypothetical protein
MPARAFDLFLPSWKVLRAERGEPLGAERLELLERGGEVGEELLLVLGVLVDVLFELGVVAHVEFERHILKPGLIFKGKGLKPVAFKLWVNTEFNLHRPTLASSISAMSDGSIMRLPEGSLYWNFAAASTRGLDRAHIYFARLEAYNCGN